MTLHFITAMPVPVYALTAPILAIDPRSIQRYFCAEGALRNAKGRHQKTAKAVTTDQQDLEEQIRLRAYELYKSRGRQDGHELEDWFRAKEELAIKKFRAAIA